jgi:hypothetical protein
VAASLRVQVIAPCTVKLGENHVAFTAFFSQFSNLSVMVADLKWSVIEPDKAQLLLIGFGHACVDLEGIDHESKHEVLSGSRWSDAPKNKPDWM